MEEIDDGALTGIGLTTLASILERLLDKRNEELEDDGYPEFFESYLTNTDLLFSFSIPWSIIQAYQGYNTSTVFLQNIINASSMYLDTAIEYDETDDLQIFGGDNTTIFTTPIYQNDSSQDIIISNDMVKITIPKGQSTPIKAVGTIFTLSNLTHKFPENLGSTQLNLLPAMIDFTLFEDDMRLMENVHIEFSHDEFDIPNGYFGQVSNIYYHLLYLYVM